MTTATLQSTIDHIADVAGWLREDQARRLWNRASEVPAGGRIVEIGSYQGRSTIVLARGSAPEVEIVAIDPHAGNDRGPGEWEGEADDGQSDNETFWANLGQAGVAERVRHVREFSQEAHSSVEGDIDLLYIDGAHGFAPALSDIEGWGGRVKPGGVMLIHDTYNSVFVTLAVMKSLYPSRTWRYVDRSTSMTEYHRVDLSAGEVAANVARQGASLPWFARNLVLKGLRAANQEELGRFIGHEPGSGMY